MARASHPFDLLVQRFADMIAGRLSSVMPQSGRRGPGRPQGSGGAGRKLDMRCRYPGCRNRSKGPRFRFLCEKHLKLPKAQQKVALEVGGEGRVVPRGDRRTKRDGHASVGA